jgi:hypothetical protein
VAEPLLEVTVMRSGPSRTVLLLPKERGLRDESVFGGPEFLRKQPNPSFRWQGYLDSVRKVCAEEGIPFEVQDRCLAGTTAQKVFRQTDSIGALLALEFPFER